MDMAVPGLIPGNVEFFMILISVLTLNLFLFRVSFLFRLGLMAFLLSLFLSLHRTLPSFLLRFLLNLKQVALS